MINRIHIIGASGSGTSTLGKALSEELNYIHLDTDNYFWLQTEEPFTEKRPRKERQILLGNDLEQYQSWILSGTLCEWGDLFIPKFDLVVYLYTPKEIRMKRLIERERNRFGKDVEPDGKRYESFLKFIDWASQYEEGGIDMRSRKLHETWLSKLGCPVLMLEGDLTVKERVEAVKNMVEKYS